MTAVYFVILAESCSTALYIIMRAIREKRGIEIKPILIYNTNIEMKSHGVVNY